MAVTFIRTLVIFSTLVLVMRLMGKRQIGEMQPFEFIITLIIADLACIPMADVSIPLIYGVAAIIGVFLLHQILSFAERLGPKVNGIISGKPSVVIDLSGVNLKELKKNNMGLEDLVESMRSAGYFSLDDLKYALFESNGKLSAFESNERSNKCTSLPVLLINDGKIENENAKKLNVEKNDIEKFITSKNRTLRRTEVMTVDGTGRTYLKFKNERFFITTFPLAEGVKW